MAPILRTYSKKQHKSNRSGVQIYQNTFKKKKIHKQEIYMMDVSAAAGLFDISSISRKVKVDDTFDRILKSENYKPVNYDPCLLCKTDSISTNDSSKSKSFIDIDNLLHRPYMTRSKCKAKVFLDSHCGKTSRLKTLDEPVTNSLEIEYDHKVNNVNYTSLNIGSTLESEDHMSLQKSNMKLVQEPFRINRDENDCRNLFHNISSAISSTPAITTKKKIIDDTLSPITTRSADAKKYGCLKDISNIRYEKAPSNASPYIRRRKTDRRRYNRIICLSNSSINSASGINGSKSIFINTMDSSHGVEYIDLRSKSIFATNDLLENKSTSSKHISDIRIREQRSINDNDSNPKVCRIRELDVSKYSTDTQNSFESSSRLEVYHESNFQGQQSNNSSNVSLYVSPKMNSAKVELSRVVLQDQSVNSNSRKDAIQTKIKQFDVKRTFENNTFDAQELAKVNFTDKIVFRSSENTKHSNLMTTKDNTTKCNGSSRILDENYVPTLNIDNLNDSHQAHDDSTRRESFAMENDTSIFSEASEVVDNNEISKQQENNGSDHIIPEQFVNSACGSETSENDFTNTFNEGSHVDDNEVSKLQKEVLVRVTNLNLSNICKTTKSNYDERDQSIYGRLVNSTRCESLASQSDITNTFNEGSHVVDDNEGDVYKLVSNGNFDNNVITRGIWENTRSRSKSSSISIVDSLLEQSKNNSGFKSSRAVDDNDISKLQKEVVVNVTNINLSDICKTTESNYDERNQNIYVRVVNSTRCESSASENDITNTFNEGLHVVDDNEGDAYKSINRGNLDNNVITRGIWENTRSRRKSCVVFVVDSSLEQSKNNSECKSSLIIDDNEVSKFLSKKSISKFQEENVNVTNFNRSDDAYKITNRGNFNSNVGFVSIVDSSLEQSTNNSKLSNSNLTSDDCIELYETRDSKFCIDLSEMKNSKDTISSCKENQNCDDTRQQINVSQENNHVSITDTSSKCVLSHSNNKSESIQNISSSSDSTEDFLGFHNSNDTSEAVQVVDTLKDTIRNEENLLSMFVRETTVTSTPKVMGPPPCERLVKRKPSVVKTGKSWRRSLYEARKIKTENDCSLNKDICKTTKSNYDERDQSIYGRLVNSTRCESLASENDVINTFNEGSHAVDDNEGDAYKLVSRGNFDNNVITRGIWENTRCRNKSSSMSIVDSSLEQSKNNSRFKSSRVVDENEVSRLHREVVVNITNIHLSDICKTTKSNYDETDQSIYGRLVNSTRYESLASENDITNTFTEGSHAVDDNEGDAYKLVSRGNLDNNVITRGVWENTRSRSKCSIMSTVDNSLKQSKHNPGFKSSRVVDDNEVSKLQKEVVVNVTNINLAGICKTTKSNCDERDQNIYGRVVNSTRCESSASENDITNTFNEGSHIVYDNEGDAYKSVNRGNLDNNVITRGIWENTRARRKSCVVSVVDSSLEQSKNISVCKSPRIVDDNEVSKLASKKGISKFQEENVNVTNFNRSDDAYKITNRGNFDSNVCGFVSIVDSSLENSINNSKLSNSKLTSDDCIELYETRDSKFCIDLSEMKNSKDTISTCKENQNCDDTRRQINVSQENNHVSIPDTSCTCVSTHCHNKGESIQNISSSSDYTEDFLGFHSGNDTSEAVQVVDTLKDTIRNEENLLSMFVRETTVTSTPKVMGPPPCERLLKRKPSVVKTGKSWRRSLYEARKIKIENDYSLNKGRVSTCTPNFTRLNCGTPALRRDSIRIVPVSATSKAPQAGSVLEKYAADVFQSYISDALPEDLLEEYLENISLTRDTLSLTLRETNLVPAVTAKEIVLRRCGQTEPLPFRKCYPNTLLHNCQKIGEGVYGEVFLFRNQNRETTVMKIIPIEGDIMVNGERQKKFSEILSEIIIAMELSNLRNNETNSTSGFSDLGKISCVQGKYPSILLDRWELYEESRGSENDSPIVFMDDQLFIVMEFTNGGKDLETFVFNNAQQAYSVFVQVTCALAIAERQLEFEHRDLHWGNILIAGVDRNKTLDFVVDGKKVELDTNGVEATIIDFTLSRITYDGVCIYNDLSLEPDLFTSSGDYQFDIYRLMQEHNGNKWQQFVPYTNVLWLHYMVDKTINALRYKYVGTKIHKCYVKKLTEVRAKMLDFKCAGEILNFLLNL